MGAGDLQVIVAKMVGIPHPPIPRMTKRNIEKKLSMEPIVMNDWLQFFCEKIWEKRGKRAGRSRWTAKKKEKRKERRKNANTKKEKEKEDISEIGFADGRILLPSGMVGI